MTRVLYPMSCRINDFIARRKRPCLTIRTRPPPPISHRNYAGTLALASAETLAPASAETLAPASAEGKSSPNRARVPNHRFDADITLAPLPLSLPNPGTSESLFTKHKLDRVSAKDPFSQNGTHSYPQRGDAGTLACALPNNDFIPRRKRPY